MAESALSKAAARERAYAKELSNEGRTLTLSEKSLISSLAMSEVSAETIKRRLAEIDYKDAEQIKLASSLNDELLDLARKQIAIHKALKIDRASRVSGKQSELEAYLPNLAERGRKFLSERAIMLICKKCRDGTPIIDIPLGTLIWHFPKTPFRFQAMCPRCKTGTIDINQDNWKAYTIGFVVRSIQLEGGIPTLGQENSRRRSEDVEELGPDAPIEGLTEEYFS